MIYYLKQGQNSIFKAIQIKENECTLSNLSENSSIKKIDKIIKKIKHKGINTIVLSKEMQLKQQIIQSLNDYDITILDGKWLMQYMLQNIIDYLVLNKNITDIDEITILSNDLNYVVNNSVNGFVNKYKKIRIVTNHTEKFKKLEEKLYEQNGIVIIITNNKRKALSKSKLIINFDFVQESINQYNINENAIIINLNDKIKINNKRFCGLVINNYEVEFKHNEFQQQSSILDIKDILDKQKEFYLKDILEEKIYSIIIEQTIHNQFETIENILKEYKIEIKELYGVNNILT